MGMQWVSGVRTKVSTWALIIPRFWVHLILNSSQEYSLINSLILSLQRSSSAKETRTTDQSITNCQSLSKFIILIIDISSSTEAAAEAKADEQKKVPINEPLKVKQQQNTWRDKTNPILQSSQLTHARTHTY